jgi:RimJ/RimL family protein N-acetyltransferase
MKVDTERLALRQFTTEDAGFILGLLNEPSFLRFIGDKGVRTLDDARGYLLKGPIDSYARNGFGLCLVSLKQDGTPIGMCGLVKRETLEHPDIGFAFLPAYWSRGYAVEAASAVLAWARGAFGLPRILAVVQEDNASSIRLLQRLGLTRQCMLRMPPDNHEVLLFGCDT